MGPPCQGKGICLHAVCVSMCVYNKSQFTNGHFFHCTCVFDVWHCRVCLISCERVWQWSCGVLKGSDVSRQAVCVMCRPASSTWQRLWVSKNCSEGTAGREIHRAEMEMWRAWRAAERRWCGDSQRRANKRGEGKRRGVQLCKIANLRLTQQPAMQRCCDVTYSDPLAYISCSLANTQTHTHRRWPFKTVFVFVICSFQYVCLTFPISSYMFLCVSCVMADGFSLKICGLPLYRHKNAQQYVLVKHTHTQIQLMTTYIID